MDKRVLRSIKRHCSSIDAVEQRVEQDTLFYKTTVSKLRQISDMPGVEADTRAALKALLEEMRYADPRSVPEADFYEELILGSLDRIKESGKVSLEDVSSLAELMKARNAELKHNK